MNEVIETKRKDFQEGADNQKSFKKVILGKSQEKKVIQCGNRSWVTLTQTFSLNDGSIIQVAGNSGVNECGKKEDMNIPLFPEIDKKWSGKSYT